MMMKLHEDNFSTTKLAVGAGGLVLFTVLANLAFWGGLIYGALWCAHHFGVI